MVHTYDPKHFTKEPIRYLLKGEFLKTTKKRYETLNITTAGINISV
jgi:hypothetical protein